MQTSIKQHCIIHIIPELGYVMSVYLADVKHRVKYSVERKSSYLADTNNHCHLLGLLLPQPLSSGWDSCSQTQQEHLYLTGNKSTLSNAVLKCSTTTDIQNNSHVYSTVSSSETSGSTYLVLSYRPANTESYIMVRNSYGTTDFNILKPEIHLNYIWNFILCPQNSHRVSATNKNFYICCSLF